jgi:biofilm protein TabA
MIADTLANAQRYQSLHPGFSEAFTWCREHMHEAIADGRVEINGDALFVMVDTGTTKPAAERRFEAHRRYIDIQVNLRGSEIMEWLPRLGLAIEIDFLPDNDVALFREPAGTRTRLLVEPGHFAIFWPEDAHKPICSPDGGAVQYRKFVFKVAV